MIFVVLCLLGLWVCLVIGVAASCLTLYVYLLISCCLECCYVVCVRMVSGLFLFGWLVMFCCVFWVVLTSWLGGRLVRVVCGLWFKICVCNWLFCCLLMLLVLRLVYCDL